VAGKHRKLHSTTSGIKQVKEKKENLDNKVEPSIEEASKKAPPRGKRRKSSSNSSELNNLLATTSNLFKANVDWTSLDWGISEGEMNIKRREELYK
jgi:hypothetical protein